MVHGTELHRYKTVFVDQNDQNYYPKMPKMWFQ